MENREWRIFKKSIEAIGSIIEITIIYDNEDLVNCAFEKCFNEIDRFEKKYSRFIENNDLAFVNSHLDEWLDVDCEFFDLIQFGFEMNNKTFGYFDLCVKNILEDLGYDKGYRFRVQNSELRAQDLELKMQSLDPKIEIDLGNRKVKIHNEIELGGLGKGYILDLLAEILKDFDNIFINGGGDIYVKGKDEHGKMQKVYFENPLKLDEVLGEVEANDLFLASSSGNKRNWGKYHHLIDPFQRNSANDMLATFVQAKSGIVADSYSTSLFVMGYQKAKEFLQKDNVECEAMIIGIDGKIWRSKGFRGELYVRG